MRTQLMILFCFEVMPVITGVVYFKKIKHTCFKWLLFYCLYIFIADVTGELLILSGKSNSLYFDCLVIPIEFLFFYWLIYFNIKGRYYLWLTIAGTVVYLLFWLNDIAHLVKFTSLSYTVGNLVLLLHIIYFFVKLIASNSILVFHRNMMFWICTGLLLFYLLSLPYYGLHNTLGYKYPNLYLSYSHLVLGLDYLMYLMFSIAFIWGKPNSEVSLS